MSNDMKNDAAGSPVGEVGITLPALDYGGSAFPQFNHIVSKDPITGIVRRIDDGMSLRDWFAGQALAGLLAHSLDRMDDTDAKLAYTLADAMLKARKGDGT